ncbi:androgen-dependent TFPI-regulating protein-like [Hyposmocoma kahamanoa]|uniref:androgen-dependent TFPI-regulating protein-like n=1 Tax=Hyposmocoma kahamanoa TaxID=1477025 RepID=UPI000E6D9989|nr:androgen-dependent TFPI-regulating protein-like [Hyposmocoma kahamanoa]
MLLSTKITVDEPEQRSNDRLLNFRLLFYGLSSIHWIIAAVVLLPIDFSVDEDPKIQIYSTLRFKFITTWFNLMLGLYLPLCLYCDWKEKCNQENLPHVVVWRKVRDVLFTSIMFPTIMFADILFWRLYYKDMSLIAPVALFAYVPDWSQHSLHTFTLVSALVDLCVVFRQRPKSLKPRFMLMSCFFLTYTLVVWQSYINGIMVYSLLGTFTGFQIVLLIVMSYLEMSFYFILQWHVIDYIWGKPKS